jgi:hypothetical protein
MRHRKLTTRLWLYNLAKHMSTPPRTNGSSVVACGRRLVLSDWRAGTPSADQDRTLEFLGDRVFKGSWGGPLTSEQCLSSFSLVRCPYHPSLLLPSSMHSFQDPGPRLWLSACPRFPPLARCRPAERRSDPACSLISQVAIATFRPRGSGIVSGAAEQSPH